MGRNKYRVTGKYIGTCLSHTLLHLSLCVSVCVRGVKRGKSANVGGGVVLGFFEQFLKEEEEGGPPKVTIIERVPSSKKNMCVCVCVYTAGICGWVVAGRIPQLRTKRDENSPGDTRARARSRRPPLRSRLFFDYVDTKL